MRILFLTFYFEPDLCAGSFRNTPLFKELLTKIGKDDFIHVITTQPNRYKTFDAVGESIERGEQFEINRIQLPVHKSGMIDQAKSFVTFFRETRKIVKNQEYDLVYASSSRLFTAFLGRTIAQSKNIPLYLDIRDLFVDTIKDVLGNKKYLQKPIVLFAGLIEKYTFSKASHINLVSKGFQGYFNKYTKPSYSFHTNGIDDLFISNESQSNLFNDQSTIIITYAGNIGNGQGLEKIIPGAAKLLGEKYLFRVIGDGGTKSLLLNEIERLNVTNVEIIAPMQRKELFEYYRNSTYLFLHLNDFDAFKKVLPSKIFEYGSFDKPVIAGVSGFAAQFIEENLKNCILFYPTDIDSFVSQLKNYKPKFEIREDFVKKFSRKNIMSAMAESILSIDNKK